MVRSGALLLLLSCAPQLGCARPLAAPVVEVPDPSLALPPQPTASAPSKVPLLASVDVLATDVVDVYAVEGAAIAVWRVDGRHVLARLEGAPREPDELTTTLPLRLEAHGECEVIHGIVGRWPDTLWLGYDDRGCTGPLRVTQFLRFHEGRWRWAGLRSPSGDRPTWFARAEWQQGVGAVFAWIAPYDPIVPGWVLPDFFAAAQETPTLFAMPLMVSPEGSAAVWISPRKHQVHAVGAVGSDAFGLQVAGGLDGDAPDWIAPPLAGTDDVRVAGVRGEPGRLARIGKGGWTLLEGLAPTPLLALRGDADRRLWAIAGEERALWVRTGAQWTAVGWDRSAGAGAERPLYFVAADHESAVVVAETAGGSRVVLRVHP